MSSFTQDELLEERNAQLQAISDRRNGLLKQYFQLLRHGPNVGSILAADEDEDDEEVDKFLKDHDLELNPDKSGVEHLFPGYLFASPSPPVSRAPSPRHQPSSPTIIQPTTHQPPSNDHSLVDIPSQDAESLIPQDDGNMLTTKLQQNGEGACEGHYASDTQPSPTSPRLQEGENLTTSYDQHLPFPGIRIHAAEMVHSHIASDSLDGAMDIDVQGCQTLDEPNSNTVVRSPLSSIINPTQFSKVSTDDDPPTKYTFLQARGDDGSDNDMATSRDPPHPLVIIAPSVPYTPPSYIFDPSLILPQARPASPPQRYHHDPLYTLPILKSLPAEFNRKSKLKQQRKREKERERNDNRKDRDPYKDDWFPMGINRWAATINANPVFKRVSRSTKCLTSKDWAVAMTELRIIRTLERIEQLKNGRWSFRQPKKQRGIGGLVKSHRDYLLDEVKWMRVDFREERKWKYAMAYSLSTSVLEWHACGSPAQRIANGICVRWRRPEAIENFQSEVNEEPIFVPASNAGERKPVCRPTKLASLGLDYGTDDDEEEDISKEQSIENSLEPTSLLEGALHSSEQMMAVNASHPEDKFMAFEPKIEEFDDYHTLQFTSASLGEIKEDDKENVTQNPIKSIESSTPLGLKSSSLDPILGGSKPYPENEPSIISNRPNKASSMFAPLRKQIAYMEDLDLFLDLERLDLNSRKNSITLTSEFAAETIPSPLELSTIFPDLQLYGMLDVVVPLPPVTADGKKRSERRSERDDPNKRAEDSTYSKLYATSKFMVTKPTLLGSLQPSKRWENGQWLSFDDASIVPEPDLKINDDPLNELFESRNTPSIMPIWLRDNRRVQEHSWGPTEDNLLKNLIDKYPFNWHLIADCFNAGRGAVPSDKRTAWDCLDRWKKRWGPDSRSKPQEVSAVPPPESPAIAAQMTTRGVKRMANVLTAVGNSSGSEPKKRRRHQLLQDSIRKAAKKRQEQVLKAAANQQRKSQIVHETHGQIQKMPKMTPQELSKLKADKDAQTAAEIRRRQEEARQQLAARNNPSAAAGQPIPLQVQPTTIPGQSNLSSQRSPMPPASATQIQQLRTGQVNISGQQRIATPLNGAARMSPQQIAHAQAAQVVQVRHAQANQPATPNQSTPPSQGIAASLNANVIPSISPQGYATQNAASGPTHPTHPVAPLGGTSSSVLTPRPSALLQPSQVPGNAAGRPTPGMNVNGHYYLTQEQLQSAIRMQMLQQQAVAAQQSQHPQGSPASGSFGQ